MKQSEYRNVRNITVPVEDPSFDGPSTITHTFTDLTPFTLYRFRVAAINDDGVGPFTHPYTSIATEPDCECITLYVCIYCNCKNVKLNNKKWLLKILLPIPLVPGPVSNLSYQITSDTSAKIMWSEPEEPNGVITGYDLTFGDYGDYRGHTMESFRSTINERSLMDLSKWFWLY